MGIVVEFRRHRSASRFGQRKEIVGGHRAVGGGFNARHQRPRRARNAPAEPADRGSISLDPSGEIRIGGVVNVEPIAELHEPKSALDARACQALSAFHAVDGIAVCAHDAQMAKTKPKPKVADRRPHFLREWRLFQPKKLIYDDVAEKLGMDGTNYGKIERGEVSYQPYVLETLAALYGCTQGDLLDRDPNDPLGQVLALAREVPDRHQKLVADTMRALLEGLP
jgi:transcriptional regulator with XRE-family HTH domain